LVEASPAALLLLAAVPVLTGIWALLSPDHVLSQEMTWDLLFNLAGAWHLHFGHVPHVDFHEPVGQLNFMLTAAGFHLFGLSPRAFLAGSVLMTIGIFLAATFVAWRRLPLLPAAVFVVFACLLTLMPANVGDQPNAYSFAMSYNRYGWSGIAVLLLILFLPPRDERAGNGVEMAVAAGLLVAMFYLKVTYFAVGMAALGVAGLVCPHIRVRWRQWGALGVVLAAMTLAPFNHPYLFDLFAAASAGGVRGSVANHLNNFLAAAPEYAPYIAALAVAGWMWWRNEAPLRLPVATGFILSAGVFLLSQNTQSHGLPAAVVIAFLFYDVIRERRVQRRNGGSIALLLSLLIFPLLAITTSMGSLAGYHAKAMRPTLQTVDRTNLRGLAVPTEKGGLLAAFAHGNGDYRLLNRARVVGTRYELSPAEYVETLLEAVALLAEVPGGRSGIALLDQVNPLPFMLGVAPPRGGNLWSGAGVPVQPAAQFFADVDRVLIPKFSTYSPWTEAATAEYGPYLTRHFPLRTESGSWILFSRAAPTLPAKEPSRELSKVPSKDPATFEAGLFPPT
jgi:hypothetical protein